MIFNSSSEKGIYTKVCVVDIFEKLHLVGNSFYLSPAENKLNFDILPTCLSNLESGKGSKLDNEKNHNMTSKFSGGDTFLPESCFYRTFNNRNEKLIEIKLDNNAF